LFEQQWGSGTATAVDPWAPLAPIMAAHRVRLDAAEFRKAVRRVLEAGGARSYDAVNQDLCCSLPAPFQLLAGDFLREFPPPNPRMAALDIGCGTGLSSELLLSTRLGAFVRHIDLVDPSQEMLQVCSTRQSLLTIRHRLICGEIENLPARARYDVVVAAGVLHQSGDLGEFLRQVGMRQSVGGIFVHVHDPNGDYLYNPEYLERAEQLARERRGIFRRVSGRMRQQGEPAARIREINQDLLREKIIRTALSGAELECVAGLGGREGRPVSMRELHAMLPDYRLVSTRSYAFFGEPAAALPAGLRRMEHMLAEQRAANGARVGAIWRKMA
jgi:2-polyprenyl-3-methyl-5-hydroxy-6-metoxy-1,4-benzoquinol methylase